MINPTHNEAPPVPPESASDTYIQLGYRVSPFAQIVNRLAALVRQLNPLALYRELQAARSLAQAYEATAIRRERQRQALCAPKSSLTEKGGR